MSVSKLLQSTYLYQIHNWDITEKFIISTGSTPSMPNIPGRELAINSDQFFEMKKIPKNISEPSGSRYVLTEPGFRV